jgi:Sec-independent protein translocase protein TatA
LEVVVNAWTVGYLIGAAVVVIVVVVLVLLIFGAQRTAQKAEAITSGLQSARDHSAALRDLDDTAAAVQRIRHAAGEARGSLTSGGQG